MSITFLDPPRIINIPSELFLPEGDNNKIKIFYSGDQPMDVIVSKDGSELKESVHIKYTVFDDYIIIFIKEVTKEDAGSYTVTCKNPSGSASGTFTVYITGNLKLFTLLVMFQTFQNK